LLVIKLATDNPGWGYTKIRDALRGLKACDFFSAETLGTFGSVRVVVFFVIGLKSRAVQIAGVRVDPDSASRCISSARGRISRLNCFREVG
jgi:hypothetical protein